MEVPVSPLPVAARRSAQTHLIEMKNDVRDFGLASCAHMESASFAHLKHRHVFGQNLRDQFVETRCASNSG